MTDQTIPVDKLRALLDGEGSAADKIQAIYDDLLPPAPLPDPLFGARATHPDHGEGIVTSCRPGSDGEVLFMFPDEATDDGKNFRWLNPSTLTFRTPDVSKNGAEIDMAYNALLFNEWARAGKYDVHKSWWHSDGELCFGGGWFIVCATTPHGLVSNHYAEASWNYFDIPEREVPVEFDGHTPAEALRRLMDTAADHAEGVGTDGQDD